MKTDEYFLFQVANQLYGPSYVSMESALSYYGIVPEAVVSMQSVSTRKTCTFSTAVGTFNYRTVKKPLYFGYKLITNGDVTFRMASLEKTILDFLYLRADITDAQVLDALRWNRNELRLMDENRLRDYLSLYNSPTLNKKIEWLKRYMYA